MVNLPQIIIVPPINPPAQLRGYHAAVETLNVKLCITCLGVSSCNPHSTLSQTGLVPYSESRISECLEITELCEAVSFWPIEHPLFLFEWTHGGASVCQGKETLQIILALFTFPPDQDVSFYSLCGFGLYCPFLGTSVSASHL